MVDLMKNNKANGDRRKTDNTIKIGMEGDRERKIQALYDRVELMIGSRGLSGRKYDLVKITPVEINNSEERYGLERERWVR